MGDLLGLGLTHYPPLLGTDADMTWVLRWTMEDPDIPAELKEPSAWDDEMRSEWGDDEGRSAAARHRASLMAGFDRLRVALDDFAPDVVIVFGDDQYENFREDIIPPFAVLAYPDLDVQPWMAMKRRRGANVWGEPEDTVFTVRGAADVGRHLVTELLARNFDMPYAYKPLHQEGLPHSFLNALLLLDHKRSGFDHRVLPISVNCYGSRVVSHRGTLSRLADMALVPDPPSPPPSRCMDLGAAIAEVMLASAWRTAIVASSSWSHAFLTDHTYRMYPDTASDQVLYDALLSGDHSVWRDQTTADIERAGQQEVLNWFCLVGAMGHAGVKPDWSEFVPTRIFNSNKVFVTYPVVNASNV